MPTKSLNIEDIRIDGGTQIRERICEDTVAEYAEKMAAGEKFPDPIVFHDGSDHWLADGFHRLMGAKRNGDFDIECDVRKGTKRDAIVFACQANGKHGLRRTNADKRRAVETMLRIFREEKTEKSNREIAERCAVSEGLVRIARESICVNYADAPTEKSVTRNGKTFTMNTAAIGRKAEPAPEKKSEAKQAAGEQYLSERSPIQVIERAAFNHVRVRMDMLEDARNQANSLLEKLKTPFSQLSPVAVREAAQKLAELICGMMP